MPVQPISSRHSESDGRPGLPLAGLAAGGAFLLVFAGMRIFSAALEPVPDVDSVRFFALAERWISGEFGPALHHPYHPLYPIVLGAWLKLFPWPEPAGHALSIVLSVLALLPLALSAREIGGARAAWATAAIFALAPVPFRLSASILTEPLFILLAAWLSWACLLAVQRHGLRWFALAGLFAGLAYFTRPEGPAPLAAMAAAVSPAAFLAAAALVRQKQARATAEVGRPPESAGPGTPGRHPAEAGDARRLASILLCISAAAAVFAAVAAPYMLSIGGITSKKRVERMAGAVASGQETGFREDERPMPPPARVLLDRFETFGKDPSVERRQEPLPAPAWKAFSTLLEAGSYAVFPLCVAGMAVLWRRRSGGRAAALYFGFLVAVHLCMFWALAAGYRYLSLRHAVPVTVMIMPAAGLGIAALFNAAWSRGGHAVVPAALAALSLSVFFVCQDLRPIRARKEYIRETGLWFRTNGIQSPSMISTDPRFSFYAGGAFVHLGECGYEDLVAFASSRGVEYLVDSSEHIERAVPDFRNKLDSRLQRVRTGLEEKYLPHAEPAVYRFAVPPRTRG